MMRVTKKRERERLRQIKRRRKRNEVTFLTGWGYVYNIVYYYQALQMRSVDKKNSSQWSVDANGKRNGYLHDGKKRLEREMKCTNHIILGDVDRALSNNFHFR